MERKSCETTGTFPRTRLCDAQRKHPSKPRERSHHWHSASTLSVSRMQSARFRAAISSSLFATRSTYDMPVSMQVGLRSSNLERQTRATTTACHTHVETTGHTRMSCMPTPASRRPTSIRETNQVVSKHPSLFTHSERWCRLNAGKPTRKVTEGIACGSRLNMENTINSPRRRCDELRTRMGDRRRGQEGGRFRSWR